MHTHFWNTTDAAELQHMTYPDLWPVAHRQPLLRIAASLASQDGVYTEADLRRELDVIGCMPEYVTERLQDYLDGVGGMDLRDLQAFLRDLPHMEIPHDFDCACTDCLHGESPAPYEPTFSTMLPHHAAFLAAQQVSEYHRRQRARELLKSGGRDRYYVAEVEIQKIRVTLPKGVDHRDEDAVRGWLVANWGRVVEAAAEADIRDMCVTDVQEVHIGPPAAHGQEVQA